jgi:CspA family cold shock protein
MLTPRRGSFLFSSGLYGYRSATMSQGTIKRLTDKGFGFIENGSGTDLFFHMSAVEGVRFEELREGQKVSYNEGRGPKGPRAENIRVL